MLAGALSSCASPLRVLFEGTVLWAYEKLPLKLLVDSGADDSFVDENLARQAGLPLVELPEPKEILDLNGHTLAKVKHRTDLLTVLVSGNQREQIQLFVIPSSSAPAILGYLWLACHNSRIDWATGFVIS